MLGHAVGDLYPSAEVTGLDLSPIQPVWVPPNVKFLVDDVEDTWLNGDNFDMVHMRNMVPILKSPVDLLREIYAYVSAPSTVLGAFGLIMMLTPPSSRQKPEARRLGRAARRRWRRPL